LAERHQGSEHRVFDKHRDCFLPDPVGVLEIERYTADIAFVGNI
jgi:hypothetical protein